MKFFLGTSIPSWLGRTKVPMFVSRPRLRRRKTFPKALGPWSLDSGGFTELNKHGSIDWLVYSEEVRRFRSEIGRMEWASPQDWMCEPFVLKKTGLSVDDHQALTIESVMDLRRAAPEVPWIPVLQGWTIHDYLRCVDRYARSGIDLRAEPNDGLGSVCRRQATKEAAEIVVTLANAGIRLHGFGFKIKGLERVAHRLVSSDSLSWSYRARREGRPFFQECEHKACNNCMRFALKWRADLVDRLDRRAEREARQFRLFES